MSRNGLRNSSGPRLHDAADLISGRPFQPHPLLRGGHAQTLAGWAWPRPWRLKALRAHTTDEDRLFESVSRELPDHIEPVRLYEAYLRNFEIESGRGAL